MKLAAVLLSVCLLCGCSGSNEPLDKAVSLRNSLLESPQCQFTCVISADYEDRIYTFQMDCTTDSDGNLSFAVLDPETIHGISGMISQKGGSLSFDDTLLAFPLMANGQLTPVSTPYIFLEALKGAYINGCSQEDDQIRIYLDDSYEDALLSVEVLLDSEGKPVQTQIFWNQRLILTADIRNFTIL